MCKTFNTIGSLTTIRSHLDGNDCNEFKSLFDLLDFINQYDSKKQQIESDHLRRIEKEKADLEVKISDLENSFLKTQVDLQNQKERILAELNRQISNLPETNSRFFPTLIDYYKNFIIWMKIWSTQIKFYFRLKALNRISVDIASSEKTRLDYLNTNFNQAVRESSSWELDPLSRKKRIIEELENYIYGAFGEYKVAKNLEMLSDEYILINDFIFHFYPALYSRKDNDYIKSIQIDHVLISRAGIFIIETKNWSEKSISNLNFHSPIKQITRANYGLFKIISNGLSNSSLRLDHHHWGDRKIPIRNLIVLINSRPVEEFQFVKILTLTELLPYIEYFRPIFSVKETQSIANYLIKCSKNKNPFNKITVHDSSYRQ